jgi:crotonobetainyl-CoA:carnitine CoA-transferase CaiB-like acyl-CoA transferase
MVFGPLDGVRVLEFGQFAAGPFAGNILADWGADVVKVEPPGGEGLRQWPPFAEGTGSDGAKFSMNFASISRNKRSVVADFGDPADHEYLLGLASVSDIVIENFRPGVMDKHGLGFEHMAAVNDAFVYCSVNGYGSDGPYRDRGAFDIAIQGISGLMSITGDPNGPPAKAGIPVADFISALYAAIGALVGREQVLRTGEAVQLECSMLSCMLSVAALQTSEYWGTGVPPERMGSAHPRNAPYQAFQASDDRYFIVAAGNDRLFRRLCEAALDRASLLVDERFESQAARATHQEALAELLQADFSERSRDEWLQELDACGVPCAPVLDYAEALSDPHVLASGVIRDMPLPNGGSMQTIANPLTMSGYEFEVYRRPPLSGEHNDEVRLDWLQPRRACRE